jgi:hypothetical protein
VIPEIWPRDIPWDVWSRWVRREPVRAVWLGEPFILRGEVYECGWLVDNGEREPFVMSDDDFDAAYE